ncbi:MAG: RNA-binding transcriptional accessory protein [Bacteroidetes bacterium]|nr:RNA-binding transcriptional accessory protein [Bacteroidota bacterium]
MSSITEKLNIRKVAVELGINPQQVETTIALLDEGATVPFLSRYRKEATGSLDEVQIMNVRDRMTVLREMEKRRAFILETIEEQGKMTDELRDKIVKANTITALEDLYLPYKPKRKTRATAAREKGLEPLALKIFSQVNCDIKTEAEKFISPEHAIADADEALDGARDIVAEMISENGDAREALRKLFRETALIRSRVVAGKDESEEGSKFRDYFKWDEKLMSCPSHRMLAMRRGENEGILLLDVAPDADISIESLNKKFIKGKGEIAEQMKAAVVGAYKRLLQPSLETEFREFTKEDADKKAIDVFAQNLRELLLASPLGQKTILALDPGFRTGCKLVVLDKQGKLLENDVIYPHNGNRERTESEDTLFRLLAKHHVEAISIGNGTAGRETEEFVRGIKELPKEIMIVMVNESGASIYSASAVAREEFPDKDVTVRGAVSIGRRLADPLAELVKIDPKSIGVGQYQHDVEQNLLKKKLDEVVESCVNAVGVELNTASKQLLSYVAGIGPAIAKSIVEYREEHGAFRSRKDILKVPRLGEKVFEQAAGFLRIRNASDPLDRSAVHPESYHIVQQMAKDVNCSVDALMKEKELRKKIEIKKYVSENIGLPTLNDILSELEKPGRDPRKTFETFKFQDGVNSMEDLKEGMRLPGIVTNVTNFGAFVDIGVHQDGLVHISQLADTFVDDPNKIVKVAQKVMVTVTEVDIPRKRIALSMKGEAVAKKQEHKIPIPKSSNATPPKQKDAAKNWQDQLAALKGKLGG